MTRRETYLAALRGEPVDEMPFVFTIDGFNCPTGVPDELLHPLDMVKIGRYMGGCVHDRLGPGVVEKRPRAVETGIHPLPDGRQMVRYETPAGRLEAVYAPSAEAFTTFLVGHCVQGEAGYEALIALMEDAEYAPSPEGIRAVGSRLAEIGDDGILYTVAPSTPIMDLTRTWVGLERFLYDLADRPDVVERAMEVMTRRAYEEYEILARSTPARVIVLYDDVTTACISPALFRRYVLPVYRTFADICHAHGKILVAHACGHIHGFLEMLVDTGVDAIDWVTPPGAGDTPFTRAQEVFRGRICVMGVPDPAVMRFGRADEVEAHVSGLLDGVDLHRGFVLMVPPPIGTPMANARAVQRIAERRAAR